MVVERQLELWFGGDGSSAGALSAVCRDGPWLWLAGDEEPLLERQRMGSQDGAFYDDRRSFRLGDFVDLPVGPDVEVDVEGLDRTDDHLWMVGWRSRTRKHLDDGDDANEALHELTRVRSHPNRQVVIRRPIADRGDNAVPVRSTPQGGLRRTAAVLNGGVGDLADVLSTDEHLAAFLTIPSKDNGLDAEGIVGLDEGAARTARAGAARLGRRRHRVDQPRLLDVRWRSATADHPALLTRSD